MWKIIFHSFFRYSLAWFLIMVKTHKASNVFILLLNYINCINNNSKMYTFCVIKWNLFFLLIQINFNHTLILFSFFTVVKFITKNCEFIAILSRNLELFNFAQNKKMTQKEEFSKRNLSEWKQISDSADSCLLKLWS